MSDNAHELAPSPGRDVLTGDDGREFLFACTFSLGPPLERHYATYAIDTNGLWCGLLRSSQDYPWFKLLDEFSGIAVQLIVIGLWNEYSDVWYAAFSAALNQSATQGAQGAGALYSPGIGR